MNPLISVVIPAFNEQKYVQRAINSIKKQTYKNSEVIVVTNGCTDNTFEIAKKTADKVYNLKSKGLAKAKNLGAHKSKGEIIIFLDADSILEKHFLKQVVLLVEKGYDCGKAKAKSFEKSFKIKLFMCYQNIGSLIASVSYKIPDGFGMCLFITKKLFYKLEKKHGEVWNSKIPKLLDVDFLKKVKKEGKYKLVMNAAVKASTRRFRKYGFLKVEMEDAFKQKEVRDWGSYK